MKTSGELIQKYNRPGPRYTSYPPVPFWVDTPSETQWIKHVKDNYDPLKGVDLYVHVPYCESLCYYCGCNRTITKNHDVEDPFVATLIAEWNLYREKMGFTPMVNSLHFGGGTPTFLSPENLNSLLKTLLVNRKSDFLGSIEIDPRTCTTKHLDVLERHSISRVSLGIQDFDPEVQKLINRYQPVELVKEVVKEIKNRNFQSMNFDLIYGLPGQTEATIKRTIEIVAEMEPDLMAFYSYAHLPERIKNQKLIPENRLPDAQLKRRLYETGKAHLKEAGYDEIGMDHFALPGSYLHEAKMQNKLQRNFMGYVDKKSGILIGLGPTSISDSSVSFIQNEKNMKEYTAMIAQGKLAIEKGHTHSCDDLLIQEIIQSLMCQEKAIIGNHRFSYWDDIVKELSSFADDGIIEISNDEVKVTEKGKPFVRNVAMTFDSRLRDSVIAVRFSQTI